MIAMPYQTNALYNNSEIFEDEQTQVALDEVVVICGT